MRQKYILFYDEYSLSISKCSKKKKETSSWKSKVKAFLKGKSSSSLEISLLKPKKAWEYILKKTQTIHAAGGLVVSMDQKFLAIYRRKTWDLPKGKVEPKESRRDACSREIQEETGVEPVFVGPKLGKTMHIYKEKGSKRPILKVSHWYYCLAQEKDNTQPQLEEDIDRVEWLKSEKWEGFLEVTFPSLSRFFRERILLHLIPNE